jgi:hypothetical protein
MIENGPCDMGNDDVRMVSDTNDVVVVHDLRARLFLKPQSHHISFKQPWIPFDPRRNA